MHGANSRFNGISLGYFTSQLENLERFGKALGADAIDATEEKLTSTRSLQSLN